MKALECWADMERQHLSAISMTKQCLHSVVCKVPLVEGAKVHQEFSAVSFMISYNTNPFMITRVCRLTHNQLQWRFDMHLISQLPSRQC